MKEEENSSTLFYMSFHFFTVFFVFTFSLLYVFALFCLVVGGYRILPPFCVDTKPLGQLGGWGIWSLPPYQSFVSGRCAGSWLPQMFMSVESTGAVSEVGGSDSARTQHPSRDVVLSHLCVRARSVVHSSQGCNVCLLPFPFPLSSLRVSIFPSGFCQFSKSKWISVNLNESVGSRGNLERDCMNLSGFECGWMDLNIFEGE